MLTATNGRLTREGKKECSLIEFLDYMGLEILCSVQNIRCVRDMWSKNPYIGKIGVMDTMGRDRWILIRTHVNFFIEDVNPLDQLNDPLWSTRSLLRNFLRLSTSIAVPTGCMTLDEATMPSKAKNYAVSYVPAKPQKYGVRYYMIESSKYQYIFTIYDNGKGHRKKTLPISYRYLNNVNLIKIPLNLARRLAQSKVPIESARALWCTLDIHSNYSYPMNKITTGNGEHRFLYVDNMYTHH